MFLIFFTFLGFLSFCFFWVPWGASGGLLELLGASPGSQKFFWGKKMLRVQESHLFFLTSLVCFISNSSKV